MLLRDKEREGESERLANNKVTVSHTLLSLVCCYTTVTGLCSMWELSVGVQWPRRLYPSPWGAPQRMFGFCWKMRGKASERQRREGGSLSCVGRLTCSSGDPASLFFFSFKIPRQTYLSDNSLLYTFLWLVWGQNVDIAKKWKVTSGIFRRLLFMLWKVCTWNIHCFLSVNERIWCLWPCFSSNHMPHCFLICP